jgi:hypothetical protein
MRGGHKHENIAHWHLFVLFPNGSTRELPELFRDEIRGIIKKDMVIDLYNSVRDRLESMNIYSNFYITWHNCILHDYNMFLKDIRCRGELLKSYHKEKGMLKVHLYDESNEEYVGSEHDLPDIYVGEVHDAEDIGSYKRPLMRGKTRKKSKKRNLINEN